MPSKGKRKSKASPSAPLKRQEPPPPCQSDCNCLGCLDTRSDASMDVLEMDPPPQPPPPPVGQADLREIFGAIWELKPGSSGSEISEEFIFCYARLRQLVGVPVGHVHLRRLASFEVRPRKIPPATTEGGSQTDPPPSPPTISSVGMQTHTRFYKEDTSPPPPKATREKAQTLPAKELPGKKSPPPPPAAPPEKPSPPPPVPQTQTRAVVLHAAPTKYKAGQMRRWVEEDNKGIKIAGIRWLLQEGRRLGKAASSLVIYLSAPLGPGHLRMGRKLFRTTEYDWDRPTVDKGKRRS